MFFIFINRPDTLLELREALSKIDNQERVNRFIDMHHYGDALLKIGFTDPVVDNEKIIVEYQSFSDVLQSLKKIGANTVEKVADKKLTRRDYIGASVGYTINENSNYPVTYEVLYGLAWKKKKKKLRRTLKLVRMLFQLRLLNKDFFQLEIL